MSTYEHVPPELRVLRWTHWRTDPQSGRKRPCRADGAFGKWHECETTFEDAINGHAGRADGVGFFIAEGSGLVGIDFDNIRCRCERNKGVHPAGAAWLARLAPNWANGSPSRRGVKLVVRGAWNGRNGATAALAEEPWCTCCDKPPTVEVYHRRRFFTVTDRPPPDRYRGGILERQAVLDELLGSLAWTTGGANEDDAEGFRLPNEITGSRHETLRAFAAALAARGVSESTVKAAIGGIDATRSRPRPLALEAGRGDAELATLAASAAEKYGAEAPTLDLDGETRVLASYGLTRDELIAALGETHAETVDRVLAAAREPALGDDDVANGRRFAARWGDVFKFCDALGGWLRWDGMRWARDQLDAARRAAYDTANAIEREEAPLVGEAKKRARLAAWAHRSRQTGRLNNMLREARAQPGMTLLRDAFDRGPHLLNTLAGVLDLRTGEVRPARPSDMLTRLVPLEYDPDAKAPRWEAFLRTILPRVDENGAPVPGTADEELIGYLRRVVGACLVDGNPDQKLHILWGIGANGKSTLLRALREVAGDYHRAANKETLLTRGRAQAADGGRPRPDLIDLIGARVVTCIEPGEGHRLNEELVKALTGGDELSDRTLWEKDYVKYVAGYKILLACNHRPVVRGADDGIWRRLRLVPFTYRIPDEEQDPRFFENELAPELPGILTWAVRGAREWYGCGLGTCARVEAATAAYAERMNLVRRWLEDACEIGPKLRTPPERAQAAFRLWLADQGEDTSPKILRAKLEAMGYAVRRNGTAADGRKPPREWVGFALREEWDARLQAEALIAAARF